MLNAASPLDARGTGVAVTDELDSLESRVEALKDPQHCGEDFDGVAWLWLAALGLILPVILILIGWRI